TGCCLETEIEQFFLQVSKLPLQFGAAQIAKSFRLHYESPPARSCLTTIFVAIGSLCEAKRKASRATSSRTPASSNMIRPGLTTATQYSGAPLPEPMRT